MSHHDRHAQRRVSRRSVGFVVFGLALSITASGIAFLVGRSVVHLSAPQLQQCARPSARSPQCTYQSGILEDRRALFPGYIYINNAVRVTVGQPYVFEAAVCGSAASSCDIPGGSARSEPSRFQSKLLVGARIIATFEGDVPGTVQSTSAKVQPVIAPTDMARWTWLIQPSHPGTFALTLTLTPLQTKTDSPLVASVPFQIKLEVAPPKADRLPTSTRR